MSDNNDTAVETPECYEQAAKYARNVRPPWAHHFAKACDAYAATLKAAQGGVTEAINWSEFWNRISQNFDSADVDKVRACYKAALSAQQGQGEALLARVCGMVPGMSRVTLQLPSGPLTEWADLGCTVSVGEPTAPPAQPAERVPEDDVRDAARYRFIRDEQATIIYKRKGHGVWEPLIDTRETSTRCASLDEAVDRAMLAASPAPSPARGDGGEECGFCGMPGKHKIDESCLTKSETFQLSAGEP